MKRYTVPTILALALAAAYPAHAQSNAELLQELKALKDRVQELEKKLAAQPAAAPAPAPAPAAGQWGMTPEQARELNRVAVKAEGLQDMFTDQGYKGLKITGSIDPTYLYNARQRNSTFVLLNREDGRYSYDNSYFGMVVLDFDKETDSGTKWKLTLAPERGTGALINAGSIVHEASVSIPLSDMQTRLWVGQIPDWTGYEYTMPRDNKLITHNLLFDTMAPTSYTGAAIDIKRGKWWVRTGLADVNTARRSAGHGVPALVYRVDYSKGEFEGFGFTGLHGKVKNWAADNKWIDADGVEQTFASAGRDTMVHALEFDAYFVRGDWSVFGQVSWGRQKGAAIHNADGVLRDAEWLGFSGTAGYKVTPRLEAVLRADYVRNPKNGGGLFGYSSDDGINGIGRGYMADANGEFVLAGAPDRGANRYALSVGMNYLYDESTILKLEFRHDGSNQAVFADTRSGNIVGHRKSNQLLGASVVVKF